jgi:Flp pilus assembly protein TadG
MSSQSHNAAETVAVRVGITRTSHRAILRALGFRCRVWRRDERGSAAIEFAIIAPVFFFLMFVIAETALVFIAEQVMDNAVFETARLIRTGQVQGPPPMSTADFKTQICNRVSVFISSASCNGPGFYLEVKQFNAYGDMVTNNPTIDADGEFQDPGSFQFGQSNSIIMVRAYYQWPTFKIFGPLSLSSQGLNGKRLIGSFAAFRNEPFTATASN